MTNRFTRELRKLKEAAPGERFEPGYERTHVRNRVARIILITLGLGLMVTAAATFFVPGPNFVLVLAGLALVGGQSRTVARLLDRGEVRARRWNTEVWDPYAHKGRVKVLGAAAFAGAVALVAWVAYRNGWLPAWIPFTD